VQGLLWVIDMYRNGICGDYRFVYERFPPTADGLLQELAAGSPCTERSAPHQLDVAGEQKIYLCSFLSRPSLQQPQKQTKIPLPR
jgi:hypothetical protein